MGALIDSLNLSKTPTGSTSVVPSVPKTTGYNPVQTLKENVGKAANIVGTGYNMAANSAPGRLASAGLGKVADIMSRPIWAYGSALQGGYQGAEKEGLTGWAKGVATGAYKGFTGQNKVTPGQYLTETVLKDKIKNPIAKAGVEFATDVVADPLNFLAFNEVRKPISAGVKKVGQLAEKAKQTQIGQKAVKFAKETPAIYKPIEAVVDPYFRNPEAGKIIEGTKEAIRSRTSQLYRYVDEAGKGLSKADKVGVGELLEGIETTAQNNPRLVEIANQFRKMGEDIGAESVRTGLLSPESYAKLKGNYMHHMWDVINDPSVAKQFGYSASDLPKIDFGPFKKRTGAEGYVKEFQAPTFKGLGTEIRSNEAAKMYQNLAKMGKTPTTAEEFSQLAQQGYKYTEGLSKAKGGDILNKTLMPQEVLDYVKRYQGTAKSEAGKIFDAAMNLWKQGKTILNPAYHVRNFLSNQILSDLQTGRGIPLTLIDYFKSIYNYTGRGNQQYFNEAVDAGLIKRKYFGEAVQDFLGTKFTKDKWYQKIIKAPKDLQTFMEETSKLNVFSEFRKQGKTVQEAMKLAEEAIFSPYLISAAERGTLGRAIPFYSFTRQAAPFIGKKLLTHPERFTKYIKGERAIESLTKPENEQYLPDYMKQMVRTPLKNKEGQTKYFNPQYIYPWGNFFNESKSSVAGLPFGFSINPIFEELYAQRFNKDPYFGSEISKPGEPPIAEIPGIGPVTKSQIEHLVRTAAPTLYTSLKDKLIPALQGKVDYQGRERNVRDNLLDILGGIKFYPFNVQQGKKSVSAQKYYIRQDAVSAAKRIRQRKDLTPEQKQAEIKKINDYRNQRLQGL